MARLATLSRDLLNYARPKQKDAMNLAKWHGGICFPAKLLVVSRHLILQYRASNFQKDPLGSLGVIGDFPKSQRDS